MSYEIFEMGPAVYIPVLLISLAITVFAFGAIPFITARTQKKTITKKAYMIRCHLFNLIPLILLAVIAKSELSIGPYLIWTSVFESWGLKTLEKRGVLAGADCVGLEDDPNRIVECTSCGYRSQEYFEACPQCGKFAKQYIQTEQENKPEAKVRFCGNCGEKLLDESKFCRKCGTAVIDMQ